MKNKYQFEVGDHKARSLICPECGEKLAYADIEIYAACPYCTCALERNFELEDFILEPLVTQWTRQYSPMAREFISKNAGF